MKATLRDKLPGLEREIILAAAKKMELVYIFTVRGCMDDLIEIHSYQIRDHRDKVLGTKTESFREINKAVAAWEGLTNGKPLVN